MAEGCEKELKFCAVLLSVVLCVLFSNTASASTQLNLINNAFIHPRSFTSASQVTTQPPQVPVRVHSGLIAAVLIVGSIALLAAVCIIKTYCFPQSTVTYRYSVLRQMEEQSIAVEEDDSDEDMLE